MSYRLLPDDVDFLLFVAGKVIVEDALAVVVESTGKRFQSDVFSSSLAPSKFKITIRIFNLFFSVKSYFACWGFSKTDFNLKCFVSYK